MPTLAMRVRALEKRVQDAAPVREMFGSGAPAALAQATAPPPAKPVAPAFPYTFMGALQEGGERTLFLSSADRVVSVKTHDTIDGVYRIDRITSDQLVVTFLPLKQQQVISLTDGS